MESRIPPNGRQADLYERLGFSMEIVMSIFDWKMKGKVTFDDHKRAKRKVSYRTELKKLQKTNVAISYTLKWLNPRGLICKTLHPSSPCFCSHPLSSHNLNKSLSLNCSSPGCPCSTYEYIPMTSLKCICKHSYRRHDQTNKNCLSCLSCLGFSSDWVCKCGTRYLEHNCHMEYGKGEEKEKENNKQGLPRIGIMELSKGKEDRVVEIEPKERRVMQQRININQAELYQYKLKKDEQDRAEYLRNKLKQANNRYFSKITRSQRNNQSDQSLNSPNAMDLYLQPHNYRNISLSNFIHSVLL